MREDTESSLGYDFYDSDQTGRARKKLGESRALQVGLARAVPGEKGGVTAALFIGS